MNKHMTLHPWCAVRTSDASTGSTSQSKKLHIGHLMLSLLFYSPLTLPYILSHCLPSVCAGFSVEDLLQLGEAQTVTAVCPPRCMCDVLNVRSKE